MVMTLQQEIKTILGPYYDENARYQFIHKDTQYSVDVINGAWDENDVAEGELLRSTIPRFAIYQKPADFIDDDWIFKQPLNKIKNLSVYDKLVKHYGFNDEDYLNGNTEALENYYRDVIKDFECCVQFYLREYFEFTEESHQALKENNVCLLKARGFKIEKVKCLDFPEMFEELDIVDKILAKTKEKFISILNAKMPKGMHHSIIIYKED